MPERSDLTIEEARDMLQRDGRYAWLLGERLEWPVNDVAREYAAATGVAVSHDTVTRWFKRMPSGSAENYGGSIGWRARRDALIVFFASGGHLRRSSDEAVG